MRLARTHRSPLPSQGLGSGSECWSRGWPRKVSQPSTNCSQIDGRPNGTRLRQGSRQRLPAWRWRRRPLPTRPQAESRKQRPLLRRPRSMPERQRPRPGTRRIWHQRRRKSPSRALKATRLALTSTWKRPRRPRRTPALDTTTLRMERPESPERSLPETGPPSQSPVANAPGYAASVKRSGRAVLRDSVMRAATNERPSSSFSELEEPSLASITFPRPC